MTAPSTPSMGPQGIPARRGGSISGGPWQLVEVSGRGTASQQGTPLITAQRSPQLQPATSSGPAELEEWNIDDQVPSDQREPAESIPTGRGRNQQSWGAEEPDGADGDTFDPQYFIGDWTDNLGHRVLVAPSEASGRQRGRRRNKGGGKGGQLVFLAVMQKFMMPEKRFNVNKDRVKKEWTCGNGVLVREDSSSETIVWKSADGKVSTWTRTPPEGPVYFDAPPAPAMGEATHPPWFQHHGMQPDPNGPVYYNTQSWTQQGEWTAQQPNGSGKQLQGYEAAAGEASPLEGGGTAGQDVAASQWNTSAPEFVPGGLQAVVSSAPPTPKQQPASAPRTPLQQPLVPPGPSGAQALACKLMLGEESPDVQISGSHLEWVLPDDWGKLNRFPKDFCLTSPMFGVRQAANMQLVFYPNGSRTAEASRCTVALTRGPDSAGIKFEFSVNGRGSGPKVCLGRRYLGDYPKPFDDSEDNKSQKVKVCMQVLEVLGIS